MKIKDSIGGDESMYGYLELDSGYIELVLGYIEHKLKEQVPTTIKNYFQFDLQRFLFTQINYRMEQILFIQEAEGLSNHMIDIIKEI